VSVGISIRRIAAALAIALVIPLTGCTPASGGDGTVALLLPESKTTRYEAVDRPIFEQRIAELGDYRVLYSNADQDPAKQQAQAEAALASGVSVLVLDPVDAEAARSIVAASNAAGLSSRMTGCPRAGASPTTSPSTMSASASCRATHSPRLSARRPETPAC
jgi:ABC-type xylose transport system substrate-binding protein